MRVLLHFLIATLSLNFIITLAYIFEQGLRHGFFTKTPPSVVDDVAPLPVLAEVDATAITLNNTDGATIVATEVQVIPAAEVRDACYSSNK